MKQAARAESLASRLPPLLVAAERLAATVSAGVHRRRRAGVGDQFWQFRPHVSGESTARVDWRQSAKSDRVYVREREWDAARAVHVWRDDGPGMDWRSQVSLPSKLQRAELLLLALTSLLVRGGEQVFSSGIRVGSSAALEGVWGQRPQRGPGAKPLDSFVVAGDFFSDPVWPVGFGVLLQVLDPAEVLLPFEGRVRFAGVLGEADVVVGSVGSVRARYQAALAERQDALAQLASRRGWSFLVHRTDQPPETALLALYRALSAR